MLLGWSPSLPKIANRNWLELEFRSVQKDEGRLQVLLTADHVQTRHKLQTEIFFRLIRSNYLTQLDIEQVSRIRFSQVPRSNFVTGCRGGEAYKE